MKWRETHLRTSLGQHTCRHRTAWGPFQTCSLWGEIRTWLLRIEYEIKLPSALITDIMRFFENDSAPFQLFNVGHIRLALCLSFPIFQMGTRAIEFV